MSGQARRNLLFLSVGLAAAGLLGAFGWQGLTNSQPSTWSYSHLVDQVERGEVKQVQIDGAVGHVTSGDGRKFEVQLPNNTSQLAATLTSDGVDVEFTNGDTSSLLQQILPFLLIIPLVGVLIFLVLQQTRAQGGGGQQP